MTRMHHEHVVRLYGVVLDMKKVMMGMAYLESNRLIHRDLAARNVLVF
ncbi:hypothetical protein COOONC_15626 [Cooperia oncophora]